MTEPGKAIRVEKPARSEFNDLPENICAFSEVKLHGKASQQIHL